MVRCAHCHKTWFAAPLAEPALVGAPVAAATAAADTTGHPPPSRERLPALAEAVSRHATNPAEGTAPIAKVDADSFWSVPDFSAAPPEPAIVDATAQPLPRQGSGNDIESEAARRAGFGGEGRQRSGRLRIPILPAIMAAELASIAVITAWRGEIVRILPQTASFFRAVGLPVNVRGLTFADVHSTVETQGGVTVLVVEGNIVNPTRAVTGVPRLHFALRDAAGTEVVAWTAQPDKGSLASEETLPFRSRLASPPAAGRDVEVRFLMRQDLTAGAQ